ncbi:hypothetical protein PHOBOS_40 [Erwinia phage vB_EamM_Phobos]|uniref:hypothetical protein n=1 Tax=Erwinia phage vB_EamM_Phobos TaxID=1883377 RepID=UPI00081CBED3|nr:hypothetical protein BIZ79_gp040 [Erwinia phage vB_EamM_Phobos]ANZ50230.1 hypothetical protein PHOBOS_40 [Erwinia phage vB_EamM_Phobos]
MSRRKKKPAYNPRSGARQEIYAAVRKVIKCEDKWFAQAKQIGQMIEDERAAITRLPEGEKKATAEKAMEQLYAAFLGTLQTYNTKFAEGTLKGDDIGCAALKIVNGKGTKWSDMELMLIDPTASLMELEAELSNLLLDATAAFMPAVAQYQLDTGESKDNAEMQHIIDEMRAQAPKPEAPKFEEVAEETTREDRADAAFEAAAQ